jgi:hypothetical protein
MHHTFKRIVVLINDISNIDDLLQKGVDFSKQHKKTLEILFVQEKPTDSLLDYFLSSRSRAYIPLDKVQVKEKIQKYINQLDTDAKSEVTILEENILERVLAHAKTCKDILFITNYDKKLSEKLLEKTPYSYWIFKNSSLTYNNILLPIELSDEAVDDIKLTQDIFPQSAIDIVHDYRYMIPRTEKDGSATIVPIVGSVDKELHEGTREKQKRIFENYKKEFHVKGDFIEEKKGLEKDIVNYIKDKETDLVVIHHQEKLMFVPSLTLDLLEDVPLNFLVLNR